jgi:hypothetical protein
MGVTAGEMLGAAIGERVGALVAHVAVVTLHPVPLHVVLGGDHVELPPQLGVLDGFPVSGFPAVPLPSVDPGFYPVLHVLRVGVDCDR